MEIKFHSDDIVTHVPTCCLIEDYWMLHSALESLEGDDVWQAKRDIQCAMECLSESIDRFTQIDSGLKIQPSVYSAIAMACGNGIIMNGDEDLKCANGFPLSAAGDSHCGICGHCKDETCCPDEGTLLLEGGVRYEAGIGRDDEAFVEALDKVQD